MSLFSIVLSLALLSSAIPARASSVGKDVRPYSYLSVHLWHRKLYMVKKACRDMNMAYESIECIQKAGHDVKPEIYNAGGHSVLAIRDDVGMMAVIDSFERCIPNLNPAERKEVVRRPVQPTTPLRALASRLGLMETVKASACGTCSGGCHFCCVGIGVSGADYCFGLYCKLRAYCT